MSKIFSRANEFYEEIRELREEGVHRGVNVGFETLDEFYTRKLGSTTYIYGAPFSGKSKLAWEFSLNTASKYDWITAVYSPESGNRAEIVAELVSMITGQEMYKNHNNAVDEDILKCALTFINSHYIFIDPDNPHVDDIGENAILTVENFYNSVRQAEKYYGIQIQETLLDPFNELSHEFSKDEGRQDLYIERILGIVRKEAKIFNRHNTIVTHVTVQEPRHHDGIIYYPPATPRQISGGQAWFRKGMMMMSVWRPPVGVLDEIGRKYEENETHAIIDKFKPKYCGKKGTATLFYDTEQNRYYEVINGNKYYAFQFQKKAQQYQKEGKILMPV